MKKPFLFTSIIYLLGAAIVFPYTEWFADNPDTFQYLIIARKIQIGDWPGAVNGYWSPLISWLLTFPFVFFKDGVIAFKVLQFIVGFFVIYQWTSFLEKTTLNSIAKKILSVTAVPLIIVYALFNLTPDLLFMGLLLTLLNLLSEEKVFTEGFTAIRAGVVGGLLFLTKAFGFPFFIAAVLIFSFKKLSDSQKRENAIRMLTTFLVISFVWILIISNKYGEATISKAISFNMSRDVAPLPGRNAELPILGKGLFAPQKNSLSAWESPGDYVSQETITPFNYPSDYFSILKRNILSIYYFDFRHQPGIAFIILLVIFIFLKRKESLKERWVILSVLFIFLMYGGYCLILFHTRYTWINILLMLALSAYFIQEIFKTKKYLQIILVSLLALWTIKRPVKEILFTKDENYSMKKVFHSLAHPFESMWVYYNPDQQLQTTISDVYVRNILKGNVASLKEEYSERDLYTSSLRITMKSGCRYFGQLDNRLSSEQKSAELKKMEIDYLITYENTVWDNSEPVYANPESKIKIYKINR